MITSMRRLALAALVATSVAIAVPVAATAAPAEGSRAARERAVVQKIAQTDPRPDVADAAWSALLSPRGAAAITDFLASGGGLSRAAARAAQAGDVEQQHDEMIAMVLAETTPESDPHLHAAALKAAAGTAAEKETFLISGLDKAREADEQEQQERAEADQRALNKDLDFVAALSTKDPGLQVRAEARWVGRDADRLRQFLTRTWAGNAEAASAAAARQRAHTATTNAWQRVLTHAETAAQGWATEQALAAKHAEVWAWVAEHAKTAATGRDWAAVTTQATTAQQQWTSHRDEAGRTAAAWTAIASKARAELT